MRLFLAFLALSAVTTQCLGQDAPPSTAPKLVTEATKSAPVSPADLPPKTYVALALADGPDDDQRVILSFRGTVANEVVSQAVAACYAEAAPGYMHTCKVWYGNAWIVGAACRQGAGQSKYGIGDDLNSPEAARANALRYVQDIEHGDISDCHVLAEYNADDIQVARSVSRGHR